MAIAVTDVRDSGYSVMSIINKARYTHPRTRVPKVEDRLPASWEEIPIPDRHGTSDDTREVICNGQ